DVARGIQQVHMAEKLAHRIYNVASGRASSNRDAFEAVRKAVPGARCAALKPGKTPGGSTNPATDLGRAAEVGYRPEHSLEAGIRANGGKATYVHLDVTREDDWRAAVATAVQAYGKLNVLVNNAGILFRAKIEETTVEDWDRIMAVNVKGVFLGTKHAIPAMRQAGGGSIVNISSTAGLVGAPGFTAAYTATKGAVRLFTKSTAV